MDLGEHDHAPIVVDEGTKGPARRDTKLGVRCPCLHARSLPYLLNSGIEQQRYQPPAGANTVQVLSQGLGSRRVLSRQVDASAAETP